MGKDDGFRQRNTINKDVVAFLQPFKEERDEDERKFGKKRPESAATVTVRP